MHTLGSSIRNELLFSLSEKERNDWRLSVGIG